MRTQRALVAVFALVLIFATLGRVTSAHHSQSGFETNDKAILLKGTVSEFRWRNPHVLIFWDVKADSGKVVRWVGEVGSVTSTLANGLNKNSLKPGDEITVTAVPSKSGTPESLIRKLVKADGTVVVTENTRD